MRKDEVLLFKNWDSDYTLTGRTTFHTPFKNQNQNGPPTESIEVRAICFFPNHKLNTCPEVTVTQKSSPQALPPNIRVEEKKNSQAEEAAKKVIDHCKYFEYWDENGKNWLKSLEQNEHGRREFVKEILLDRHKAFDFQNLSQQEKDQALQILSDPDNEFHQIFQNSYKQTFGSYGSNTGSGKPSPQAEDAAKKVINHCKYFEYWDENGKNWLKSLEKNEHGRREFAKEVLLDRHKAFDLQNLSQQEKDQALQILSNSNNEFHQIFKDSYRQTFGSYA